MSASKNEKSKTNNDVTKLLSRNALLLLAGLILGTACSQAPYAANIEADGVGIIGGQEVEALDDNVYSNTVVSLINVEKTSICTASIIAPDLLLTAAHCVDGPASHLRIVFGPRLVKPVAPNTVVREVDSYMVSPLWAVRQDMFTDASDIAVVKFSGGLPDGYKVIPLLADSSVLSNGSTLLLAGYGLDDFDNQTGSGVLRFTETVIESVEFSATEILLNQQNGKGACPGDSGGPAYFQVGDEWYLAGVTSRIMNKPAVNCSGFSVYTLVSAYADWIQYAAETLRSEEYH